MSCLLDTNILLRFVEPAHPMHGEAARAVERLSVSQQELCIAPQNLIEFFSVATKSASINGLGMNPHEAYQKMEYLEKQFFLLPDREEIFHEWRRLVMAYGISGARVHDARLAAVMLSYGITHLLTFDLKDFQIFKNIIVISPQMALET